MSSPPRGAVTALGAIVLVLVAFVGAVLAAGVAVGIALATRGGTPDEAFASVVQDPLMFAAIQLAGFGLAAGIGVVATHGSDVRYREALAIEPVPIAVVVLAITGGFALQFPLAEVVNLLAEIGGPFALDPARQARVAETVRIDGVVEALTVPLALVAVTPIAEELLFRGVLLPGFEVRYGARAALFASSVLFGLVHLALPAAAVYATIAGLVLGWLRQRTGSLLPSIAAHGACNAAPIVLSSDVLRIQGFNGAGDDHLPIALLMGSLAVAALSFFAVARLAEEPPE